MDTYSKRSASILGIITGLLVVAVIVFFHLPSQAKSPELLPGISMQAEAGYLIHSDPLAPGEFLQASSLSETTPAEGKITFRSERSEGENIFLIVSPKNKKALEPFSDKVILSVDEKPIYLKDFLENPPVFYLKSGESKTISFKALLDNKEELPLETVLIRITPTPESLLEVKK